MDRRLLLQTTLEQLRGPEPEDKINTYFQPPQNVSMVYPAIRYFQDDEAALFADDSPYHRRKRYQVTVIDRAPDSDIPDKVAELPLCKFNRAYVADNLNHTVYTLYF